MVIPNIEDEKSVENFCQSITGSGKPILLIFNKLELSLSFDEEVENNRVRLNSLDDTLEDFNFEEKEYVETAILPDEDSDSEGKSAKYIKTQSDMPFDGHILKDLSPNNSEDLTKNCQIEFPSL